MTVLTSREHSASYLRHGVIGWDADEPTTRRNLVLAIAVIGLGIAASMLGPWEMDGETWGYWYFARIFNETGQLSNWDRAPAYVVYLSPFLKLGYPRGVLVEYAVTSAIFCASFVSLFYRTRLMVPAALAAVLLLPTVWISPPGCQILALSCSFFAFASLIGSRRPATRAALALFFAVLAYLFRSTYVVVLLLTFGYILFSGFLEAPRRWQRVRIAAIAALPAVALVVAVFGYTRAHQADHPWNNVFFTSTQWFPVNAGSLFDSGFVSHMNWAYIAETYPESAGVDFYRTNQELFNGAATAREAVAANPRFVVRALAQNVVAAFETLGRLTSVPVLLYKSGLSSPVANLALGAVVAGLLAVIAFGKSFPVAWRVMFIALTGAAVSSVLSMPKSRYFVGVAPLLFFIAVWLVGLVRDRHSGSSVGAGVDRRDAPLLQRIARPAAVFAVFAAISYATLLAYSGLKTANQRRAILENTAASMKAQYSALVPLAAGCSGILTLEHGFFGAFVARDATRVYDVFEVPPFGSLGNGPYSGLDPARVDCVFVSAALASGASIGTDTLNRYRNYIEPYSESLLRAGATKVTVPGYGFAILRKR